MEVTPINPDAEAPTFAEMREAGLMLIDTSVQKLAVYPGGGGCVVLKDQFLDGLEYHVIVDAKFVPALIAALTKAAAESEAKDAEVMAVVAAQWDEYDRRMQSAKVVILKPNGDASGA